MTKILTALTVLLLAGCVNVHVHFPAAQDALPKPAEAGGNDKK